METTAQSISKAQLEKKLPAINSAFGVSIVSDQLLVPHYSFSSATDFLAAKIEEELNGEWSLNLILQKISHAIDHGQLLKEDALLSDIFPRSQRRTQLKEIGKKIGYPLEKLLRPRKTIYAICLILLFLCIPAAISLSWFFSGITALVLVFILYYLDGHGNEFRNKTLMEFAEEIEWKRNMQFRKSAVVQDSEKLKNRIREILTS
jgi:hypothetical protein